MEYISTHEVLDILTDFSSHSLPYATLLTHLKPLQPRYYSIASSPAQVLIMNCLLVYIPSSVNTRTVTVCLCVWQCYAIPLLDCPGQEWPPPSSKTDSVWEISVQSSLATILTSAFLLQNCLSS